MRSALILAYYFPPVGLGGVQRPLKFAGYLPDFDWRPIVTTVRDIAYYNRDTSLLDDLPDEVIVSRTGSLDPLRIAHLLGRRSRPSGRLHGSGRSLARWMLFPDHQVGWLPFAVARALRLIRTHSIEVVLSTSPPATSHLAGYLIHRLTGLPWVADFRDAWIGGEFDPSPTAFHRRLALGLQHHIVKRASHVTAVSEDIAAGLKAGLSKTAPFTVITNGYDVADFNKLPPPPDDGRFILTYCGTMNKARDPEPLFQALQRMAARHKNLSDRMEVRLVGEDIGVGVSALAEKYEITSLVSHLGYLPHRDAVSQILAAHALVMFITSESGLVKGVPTGKIYEYLGSGKPMMAIAPEGAASELINRYDRGRSVSPDDIPRITETLETWLEQHLAGELPVFPIDDEPVRIYSRYHLTGQLAQIFDHVATPRTDHIR